MKKSVCMVLAVLLFASFAATPVSAASVIEAVPLPLPEYEGQLPSVVPFGASRSISCAPGAYSQPLAVDYYVTQGVTELTIESCTWYPQACDIVVGFYPCVATNIKPAGATLSGGSAYGKTIGTSNVPSGMYWVYVYNAGYTSVTGQINFSISG